MSEPNHCVEFCQAHPELFAVAVAEELLAFRNRWKKEAAVAGFDQDDDIFPPVDLNHLDLDNFFCFYPYLCLVAEHNAAYANTDASSLGDKTIHRRKDSYQTYNHPANNQSCIGDSVRKVHNDVILP
jgi:hypothetical protein